MSLEKQAEPLLMFTTTHSHDVQHFLKEHHAAVDQAVMCTQLVLLDGFLKYMSDSKIRPSYTNLRLKLDLLAFKPKVYSAR